MNFPKNLIEFQQRFNNEEDCFAFIKEIRWPEGFKCHKCGHKKSYDRGFKSIECAKCRTVVSATAGTVMHRSKQSLVMWMWAAWLMVNSKGGISAMELARQFGVNREIVFQMLHKLRHAMVAPERTKLTGVVEVDEAFIGSSRHGHDMDKKSIVVGAVEIRGKKPTRLRLRVVKRASWEELKEFVEDTIDVGSRLMTDGNRAYAAISGYKHTRRIAGRDGAEHPNILPYFHTAIGNLRAWINGTHHGAIRPQHLQAYLDEFCFRYNRRNNLALAFVRLLELTPLVGKLTYEDLYSKGEK